MFLDTKITHHNQQLKTSVYRKPTLSGVFTHYESYLDQSYKKPLIDTLLLCCFSICSDNKLFHLEVENVREILKRNIYPSWIIEQFIKSFLNKLYVLKKSNSIPTVPTKKHFILLPYLATMSSNLEWKLRTSFKNSLPKCDIIITLTSFFSFPF